MTKAQTDDENKKARKLFDDNHLTMTLLADDGETSERYAVASIPHTVVIDREGIVYLIARGGGVDIPAVVSNHTEFADLVESHGIPFIHLPVKPGDPDSKAASEQALLELLDKERIDLVVLARYMQVLSPQLCEALAGRAINIHHSFLPSFKGARPYQQAHARGVKIIGATAHYVTSDLDEGPIIEQDVERVNHTTSAEQMAAVGRDVECQVLARAVAWHTQNRVMINGNRTIVFR